MKTFAKRHNCVTARSLVLALVAVLSVSLSGSPCLADMNSYTYSFYQLTDNHNTEVISQFTVNVTAVDDQAKFTFYNTGLIPSSITGVYFDDGTLFGIASIINGTGVSFTDPATPGDLPGGNLAVPPFVTTDDFSADSTSPDVMASGVNPGENVAIVFDLIDNKTLADTIAALANGSLRIGLHVQAIDPVDGLNGSESFIAVPAPGAVLLGLLGLGAAGLKLRRMA